MPKGITAAMFWAIGIGVIALVLVILLIIFGNLSGNLGFSQASSAISNETIVLNDSGNTPTTAQGRVNGALSNIVVINATGGETVPSTNYTISGVVITANTGPYNGTSVRVTGTVSYDRQASIDAETVISNYSESATNISTQFPTVGTIVGIALLLVVLIGILAFAISKMMGVASNPSKSSGSFEQGGFG